MDPETGILTGGLVPESQWKQLPCHSKNKTTGTEDEKYLNLCDSEFTAASKMLRIAAPHGTKLVSSFFNCGYDGSFGRIQTDGTT